MPLTMVDIVISAIVLASALMALLRGFVREVLSIAAWLTAVVVAIYLLPFLRTVTRAFLDPPVAADIIGFAAPFLIVLVPALMLTNRASSRLGRDTPGALDRAGGFAFGAARGLFIIGLVYWVNSTLMAPGQKPGWLENARLKPLVVAAASLFPEDINALATSSRGRERPAPQRPRPESKASTSERESDKGYGRTDRLGLDQLVTTTDDE